MTLGFAGVASSTCDSRVPVSGELVSAMGHMHTLGKSFRLTLQPDTPDAEGAAGHPGRGTSTGR